MIFSLSLLLFNAVNMLLVTFKDEEKKCSPPHRHKSASKEKTKSLLALAAVNAAVSDSDDFNVLKIHLGYYLPKGKDSELDINAVKEAIKSGLGVSQVN